MTTNKSHAWYVLTQASRRSIATRLSVLAWVPAILLAPTVGVATARAAAHQHHLPVILLDQTGRGSAYTSNFRVNPNGPWGVTYVFRCLPRSGDFSGVVWDASVAAPLVYTTFSAHGKTGRGLRMETGATSNIWAPNGVRGGKVLDLQITTRCAWHVRVVAGTRALVQRHAPTRI